MKRNGEKIIVERGDSLASIAYELGIEIVDLLSANPGVKGRILQIGWPLDLPLPRNADEVKNADEGANADELEPENGMQAITLSPEELAHAAAMVAGFHTRIETIEKSIEEIRKLAADGFEAHQDILKKFNEGIEEIKKEIAAVSDRVHVLEIPLAVTKTEPAPKDPPQG